MFPTGTPFPTALHALIIPCIFYPVHLSHLSRKAKNHQSQTINHFVSVQNGSRKRIRWIGVIEIRVGQTNVEFQIPVLVHFNQLLWFVPALPVV